MGWVDKNDAQFGFYSSVCKSYKWSIKVFFHFLEEAVFNSFVVYNKCRGIKRFLQLKIDLKEQLLKFTGATRSLEGSTDRLRGRHFPSLIPPTACKALPQRRCTICLSNGKWRDVRYCCESCVKNPALW